jgi:hypothetical protein
MRLKVCWYVGLGIVDVGNAIVGNRLEVSVEYGLSVVGADSVGCWTGVGLLPMRSCVGRSHVMLKDRQRRLVELDGIFVFSDFVVNCIVSKKSGSTILTLTSGLVRCDCDYLMFHI